MPDLHELTNSSDIANLIDDIERATEPETERVGKAVGRWVMAVVIPLILVAAVAAGFAIWFLSRLLVATRTTAKTAVHETQALRSLLSVERQPE